MSFKEIRPKNDEEWLEIRRTVLTATDIGVILGLNKWKSVAELVKGKENFEPFENSYTWLGQVLEPVVVEAVNKAIGTNFKLYEDEARSFFVDREIGLGATPDAHEGSILLECKSTKPGNHLRWHGWPPAYYLSQLYTQMICTEKDTGYLAIMSTNLTQKSEVLDLPLLIHQLSRHSELDEIFFKEVKRFWDTQNSGKMYRVNRKQAPDIEMFLRFQTEQIYGR